MRGWIKSPQEAMEEMDISIEEATRYWKSNFTLLPSHVPNLLPNIAHKEEIVADNTENNTPADEPIECLPEKCVKSVSWPSSLFDFQVA